MCMIDDADGSVTMLASGERKARTTHKCSECRRTIAVGDTYLSERFVWEGEFHNHKTCAHCLVARRWLSDECGGWCYGAVEDDLREHAQQSYYAVDVKRLAIGMQWRWRAPSGRMLPTPKAPLTTIERQQRTVTS